MTFDAEMTAAPAGAGEDASALAPPAAAAAAAPALRPVPASRHDRLARAATRPVRIALIGEFSVGKSTLANLVLGADVAAVRATSTHAPAIWFSGAKGDEATLFDFNGSTLTASVADLSGASLRDCAMVRAPAPRIGVRSWELIDTPGLSDPSLDRHPLPVAVARADAVVMMTLATQAWRRSEMEAFSALPPRLRRRAVLVAAGADRLGEADLAKVLSRLRTEADPAFRAILPVSSVQAGRARAAHDAAGWAASGAAALFAQIDALVSEIAAERRAMLDRYVRVPDPVPAPAPEPMPAPAPAAAADPVPAPAPAAQAADQIPAAAAGPAAAGPVSAGTDFGSGGRDPHAEGRAASVAQSPTKSVPGASETRSDSQMPNNISDLRECAGFIGACLVDSDTGLMLASEGGANFDLETAAAANTSVVKAKLSAMQALGLDDAIEDILITLGTQFHLIRPLASMPTVFIYVALDRKTANLGMARIQTKKVEGQVKL
ncbi:GTPase [Rhodovulum sp. DZ06]|uniref:GTPase n=1 Tax=Rhodovulum sp. DZ06 TaxID=3425126 RepID=UPI003D3559C0